MRTRHVNRFVWIDRYRTNKLLERLDQDSQRIQDMKEQFKQLQEEV
jgi:hypothetical protein